MQNGTFKNKDGNTYTLLSVLSHGQEKVAVDFYNTTIALCYW